MRLVIQKNGHRQYVSFRESFWDKTKKKHSSRTVKNFGRLDLLEQENPNILEELRKQVDEYNAQKEAGKQVLVQKRLANAVEEACLGQDLNADNRTVMIGATPLRQVWNALNLPRKLRDFQNKTKVQFDLPEAVFYMVAARSLMPDSKLGQWQKRNGFLYGGPHLKLCHLYRALDQLIARKDELIAYLNRQIAKQYSVSSPYTFSYM